MTPIKFTKGEITDYNEELCTLTLWHNDKKVYLASILKIEIDLICDLHKNIIILDDEEK